MTPDHRDQGEPAPDIANSGYGCVGRTFVRVVGTRLGQYVEFEFSLNDSDLSVDLVLPFQAFDEFCEKNRCTILPAKPGAWDNVRGEGAEVGLYRRPPATDQ